MTAKRRSSENDASEQTETANDRSASGDVARGPTAVARPAKGGAGLAQPPLQPSTVYFLKGRPAGEDREGHQRRCFGLIETRGFLPLVVAADAMLKAANIELIRYERVMGELAAICVVGDISAVRIAVESGIASAETYGEVVASAVLSNPAPAVTQTLCEGSISVEGEELVFSRQSAIGILEARGFVCAVVALDAMLKAASVKFCGFENTVAGTVVPIIMGDLSAVRYAVDAGVEAGNRIGEVVASQVLARPQVTKETVLPVSEANLSRLIPSATGR